MSSNTAASYDAIANHYHLIFKDWDASIKRQSEVLSAFLEQKCDVPKQGRILDCACGIGTQALGLAQFGFQVAACDLSPKAIERAKIEASRRGLAIHFSVANMLELSSCAESHLDAAICMDNSLPHLLSPEELVKALEQIRTRLHSGGVFVASIRDYDRLLAERPVVHAPEFYSDEGRRRIVFQLWDWIDAANYEFHLYITCERAEGWQTFHTSAAYRAYRRNEISAALSQAQFKNVRWFFPDESGFYQPIVVAEAD